MKNLTVVMINVEELNLKQYEYLLQGISNLAVNRKFVFDDMLDGRIVESDNYVFVVQDYSDKNGDVRYSALEYFLETCGVDYLVLQGGYRTNIRFKANPLCAYDLEMI